MMLLARMGSLAFLFLGLLHPPLAAAQFNFAATAGAVQYDAGGDQDYFILGLQVRYYATPVLRVGFLGGTAHIGDPPLRDWTLEGTDERIWRGAGFLEVAGTLFPMVSLSARGFLGVVHSSGVIVETAPPNSGSWYGITDTPTGVTYGGGIGLEGGPFLSRMRFLAQANFWRDHLYGGGLSDPELIFGLGIDL